MSESQDELLIKAQGERPPYIFNPPSYVVEIDTSRNVKVQRIVAHRIAPPDLEAYRRQDNMTKYEYITVSGGEQEEKIENFQANVTMYDAFAREVKGYLLSADEAPEELEKWRPLTPDLLAQIPGAHKSRAINDLFLVNSTVRDDGRLGYVLGGSIPYVVDQEIGPGAEAPFLVTHTFRELEETERLAYEDKASSTRSPGGARQQRSRVITHINASIECFNLAIQDVEGGVVLYQPEGEEKPKRYTFKELCELIPERGANGELSGRDLFLKAIPPPLKRNSINEAVKAMRARSRD